MSLARAFTTRRANNKNVSEISANPFIGRAASQRSPKSKPIQRSQISLPVALISTTNMLSYEAPDIEGTARINTEIPSLHSSPSLMSDHSSDDESDRSSTSARSQGTAATSVDDYSPTSPPLNHLSCYFKPSGLDSSASSRASHSTVASSCPSFDSPSIPQRAPSHTKKAHALSHKRSVQRMAGQPAHERNISRDSADMFSKDIETAPTAHPFGKELEQLNEAAEEFGNAVRDAEAESDIAIMRNKGLVRFCANDYMSELSGLYASPFADEPAYQPMIWI